MKKRWVVESWVNGDIDDEWGYSWVDTEYGNQRLQAFKTWREIKEERRKNED